MKKITVDLVIFQLQEGKPLGVSRIWGELLPRLIRLMPDMIFDLCVRGSNPEAIEAWNNLTDVGNPNVRVYSIDQYQWGNEETNARGSDLFLSTYYTYSPHCKNLLYIYDMIPEELGWTGLEWDAKNLCVEKADRLVCMSQATKINLARLRRETSRKLLDIIIPGAVDHTRMFPANQTEIEAFRKDSGIEGKYIMTSGRRGLYKNAGSIFDALLAMPETDRPTVLLAGGEPYEADDSGLDVVYVDHMDDDYLRPAYSGAVCLYYPSTLEGFGLPVAEAMACGCPVILGTAPVFQEFAKGLVVESPWDAQEVIWDLTHIQVPQNRLELVEAGLQAAKRMSWDTSAALLKEAVELTMNGGLSVPTN